MVRLVNCRWRHNTLNIYLPEMWVFGQSPSDLELVGSRDLRPSQCKVCGRGIHCDDVGSGRTLSGFRARAVELQ